MTNLVFSNTERKQIALRFKTLYQTVIAKTWTTGYMGESNDVKNDEYREYERDDLRLMGKKKKNRPKHLKMCLVGAAAYVNGPTEEEILALLATQIIIEGASNDKDVLYGVWEWAQDDLRYSHLAVGDVNDAACALILFEQLLMTNPFDGAVAGFSKDAASESIVIDYNDDHAGSAASVRGVIKRAAKLYDKLEKVWLAEQKLLKMKAIIDKDFAGLNKLFG